MVNKAATPDSGRKRSMRTVSQSSTSSTKVATDKKANSNKKAAVEKQEFVFKSVESSDSSGEEEEDETTNLLASSNKKNNTSATKKNNNNKTTTPTGSGAANVLLNEINKKDAAKNFMKRYVANPEKALGELANFMLLASGHDGCDVKKLTEISHVEKAFKDVNEMQMSCPLSSNAKGGMLGNYSKFWKAFIGEVQNNVAHREGEEMALNLAYAASTSRSKNLRLAGVLACMEMGSALLERSNASKVELERMKTVFLTECNKCIEGEAQNSKALRQKTNVLMNALDACMASSSSSTTTQQQQTQSNTQASQKGKSQDDLLEAFNDAVDEWRQVGSNGTLSDKVKKKKRKNEYIF